MTFGPVSNAVFLAFLALALEKKYDAGALLARLRRDLPRVQLSAWRFWPAVAALNYRVRLLMRPNQRNKRPIHARPLRRSTCRRRCAR